MKNININERMNKSIMNKHFCSLIKKVKIQNTQIKLIITQLEINMKVKTKNSNNSVPHSVIQ